MFIPFDAIDMHASGNTFYALVAKRLQEAPRDGDGRA